MAQPENQVLGASFSRKHVDLITTVCEQRGESKSTLFRRAVLRELAKMSYLSPEEKKALGVNDEG